MADQGNGLAQGRIRDEWKGSWIWANNIEADRNVYTMFRRSFATGSPGDIDIHITADTYYWLYVDNTFVSRGPSRSLLGHYSFDTHSIDVPAGDHTIAVLVHHVGEINATSMLGRPGLIIDALFTPKSGPALDISSSCDWKASVSPAWKKDIPELMSHFGFLEILDMRLLPETWFEIGFDDSAWSPAFEIGRPPCAPWKLLVERDIKPLRLEIRPSVPVASGTWQETRLDAPMPSNQAHSRIRERSAKVLQFPIRVEPSDEGRYITFDFGRTTSGYAAIKVTESTPGQQVDVSFDELITASGAVNPERTYARMTDRYVLAGGQAMVGSVHPRGFRYITLDVLPGANPVVIESVEAIEETYPFEIQESFSSSDDQLERFCVKSALTVRISTQDAFLDCPTRERVQWMEDMYMHNRVAAYVFGDTQLSRRGLFQGAQSALPDGRINGFFPTDRDNLAFAGSSIMWLGMLADYWLHSGSDDIRALLPTARRLVEFIDTQLDDHGLIARWPATQFWDWAPLPGDGCLLTTNAAYAVALNRLSEHSIFTDAIPGLKDRANRLCAAATKKFWSPERGLFVETVEPGGAHGPLASQHGNALAVLAGICPPERAKDLLLRITDPANLGPIPVGENAETPADLETSGKIIPVGTLWFAHFICEAFFKTGMDVGALDQIRAFWSPYEDLPLMPETRIPHGNIGYCHGWACGPAFLLPAYVLGVQPTGRGWSEISFSPSPGDLEYATGVFMTPAGPLAAYWTREGADYRLALDLPEGVRAKVSFGGYEETVRGGGRWERTI